MTANDFYAECLEGFVTVARGFGYANGGALGNEVLMKRAELSVRELLKIKPLIKMLGNDAIMYYYEINGFAFAMGVVLAMLQLNAPQKFAERDIIPMIAHDPETSPHELAFHTLQQFGMDLATYNLLVQDIFKKFQELHEPYWKVKESRDYTLAAFYASFMTGCSISIDKFNEKRAQKQFAAMTPVPTAAVVAESTRAARNKPAVSVKKTAAKKPTVKKATAAKKTSVRTAKKAKGIQGN